MLKHPVDTKLVSLVASARAVNCFQFDQSIEQEGDRASPLSRRTSVSLGPLRPGSAYKDKRRSGLMKPGRPRLNLRTTIAINTSTAVTATIGASRESMEVMVAAPSSTVDTTGLASPAVVKLEAPRTSTVPA